MPSDPVADPLQVLFVEDEPDNRLVLMARFQMRFRCSAAEHADAALQLLATRPVAVLVSDQRMPGRSGIDLCDLVRERWPDTRRVLLTAAAERESAIDAINRGVVHAYVDKPWDPDRLEELLRLSVAEVEAAWASAALRQALLEREQLEAAAALRRELLHDLASAVGMADLGYDAVADVFAQIGDRMSVIERSDLEQGLAAMREGLNYMGRLQAELRRAAREDTTPTVERVGDLLRLALRLTGATRRGRVELDGDLERVVLVDRVSVCRVLANLLFNALEAGERLQRPVRLWLAATAEAPADAAHGAGVVLSVEDDGPGIDATTRDRVFERGFTTRREGAGLGLALSRDLARREGGDLRLTEPLRLGGSRFELWLPAGEVSASAGPPTSRAPTPSATAC